MKIKRMMLWIVAIIFFALLVFNLVGFIVSGPKYRGEVSDHFNGKTFENLGGAKAKGLQDVIKWVRTRKKEPWVGQKVIEYGPKPSDRIDDGIGITFVNHSTFLIQVDGMNILTDPIWSERTSPVSFAGPKRMRPPGIAFEDLPDIDLVLISHNHYDHLDVPTMKKLIKKYHPKIITPLGVGAFVENLGGDVLHDIDWWEEAQINDQLTIACVPAQHFSGRGTFDRDATLWCGYVIKRPTGSIYFAGDSGYGDFFKEIGIRYPELKVSMIPIGAYLPNWFMSPIHISPMEAVQVHQDVGTEYSIAMHYGTFPLADDGQTQAVDELTQALEKEGLTKQEFSVLKEGDSVVF